MPQYKLRDYQQHVVDKIGRENAIVKMPTGSGKTFVAAEFIRLGLETKGKKIDDDSATVATEPTTGSSSMCTKSTGNGHIELAALFLVPTCDLVSQQKRAIEAWIGDGYEVAEYMGSKACPTKRFDVLVSTPQAFLVGSFDTARVLVFFVNLIFISLIQDPATK
jgi:superfamily II DNA or RNA helicase